MAGSQNRKRHSVQDRHTAIDGDVPLDGKVTDQRDWYGGAETATSREDADAQPTEPVGQISL